MADALWRVMTDGDADIADMLVFLPSRRAVRTVEKMIVTRMGGAAILPRLVALGEGAEPSDFDDDITADVSDEIVPDILRVCIAAKLLAADANIGGISAALPVARDLIRMTDYLENEGVDIAAMDWTSVVDEKFAAHFQAKAQMLNIIARVMPLCGAGRQTRAARRNADIRGWIDVIGGGAFSRVIVCASTASVPATADLMAAVAAQPNGRIILSGKISGTPDDLALDTNPYNSEYRFLSRIGCAPSDVAEIDVGTSAIDFFDRAFGNNISDGTDLSHISLIECAREAEEAAAAAEIAARAVAAGQSVLIITPDAAANQRLRAVFAARELVADFSGGTSGAATGAGRAILNLLDAWTERDDGTFVRAYANAEGDLLRMISNVIDAAPDELRPLFDMDDASLMPVWTALDELSHALSAAGIEPSVRDARAFVADALSAVTVRPAMRDDARICVLGTIESRMQTADVVILTGLNEGMFPARGYENAWLPRSVAAAVGLPPADRKVSLMSLDFMNLSCGSRVYWLRSKMSGGAQTTESRFISRVTVHGGAFDRMVSADILGAVRGRDAVARRPLNPGRAAPGADWSEVYVTELELLIHNPYAFYARHILRLRPMDDWWAGPDARTFGTLVHDVIEHARDLSPDALVAQMDSAAREKVGTDSVLFHFWHRRFTEMAPIVSAVIGVQPGRAEIDGAVRIPVGANGARTVRARADRVCDGLVMDIKTGAAPSKKQLSDGTMPQLPLEAYMLQSGGFPVEHTPNNQSPEMMFLQLRAGDVRAITYDAAQTREMIAAALDKVRELFGQYTAGAAEYEYRLQTDAKYRAYDDLARADD